MAQLKRVNVHRVYEDNDTSAYKRRVKVSTLSETPARAGSAAGRIVREWEGYTVDMKRQEIMRRIESVMISGAGKGGAQRGVFRPELLPLRGGAGDSVIPDTRCR
ncbi:hypothetical protein ACFYXW_25165 [Streptomyces sp. NPDC001981]|uniref:hypothetical protein n=1 Tax=Streptomyces sp. NPDC001981 TaxID=3364628 RepID=UPI0036CD8280